MFCSQCRSLRVIISTERYNITFGGWERIQLLGLFAPLPPCPIVSAVKRHLLSPLAISLCPTLWVVEGNLDNFGKSLYEKIFLVYLKERNFFGSLENLSKVYFVIPFRFFHCVFKIAANSQQAECSAFV